MNSDPVPTLLAGVCAALTVLAVSGCSGSSPTVQAPATAVSSSPAPSSTTTTASSSTTSRPALKDDPVDKAFHAKAEAMCVSLLTDKVKHQPPNGFSLTNVDPAVIAPAASAFDAQSMTHTLVSTANSLASPSTAAASWSVVIGDFGAYEKAAQAFVATAKSGNAAAFVSTLGALEGVKSAIRDDLHAVGFSNKSSCDLLFAPAGTPHGG